MSVDVHGPGIPKRLGLEGKQIGVSGEDMSPVHLADNLAVMSIGFLLPDANEPVIWPVFPPPTSTQPIHVRCGR